ASRGWVEDASEPVLHAPVERAGALKEKGLVLRRYVQVVVLRVLQIVDVGRLVSPSRVSASRAGDDLKKRARPSSSGRKAWQRADAWCTDFPRSEERRVGKECRSRWAREH